jgi:hypothetical protein
VDAVVVAADAASGAAVIRVLFSTIAALRPHHKRASQSADEISLGLIVSAYMLFVQASDEASEAIVREEAARLRVKRNKRSGLAHLAIDIAFPLHAISPSQRTLYSQALLGGKAQNLTTEEFRKFATTGPTGRGGLSDLARRAKKLAKGGEGAQAHDKPSVVEGSSDLSPQGAGYRASPSLVGQGPGHLRMVVLTEAVAADLAATSLKVGDEFQLVVKVAEDGAFEAVKLLGIYPAAAQNS